MFGEAEIEALPRVPAVYALLGFTPSYPILRIGYIGQTVDISRRLGEHRRSGSHPYRVIGTPYFSFAPVCHAATRLRAEANLINLFRPAANRLAPAIATAETTTPPPLSILPPHQPQLR